jgi:NADH-quinone oxidoreductase subunit M
VAEMKDINGREWLVLGAFAALTVIIGVWPEPLTHLMGTSVDQLVQVLAIHKV